MSPQSPTSSPSYWPTAAPDDQGMNADLLTEMVDTVQGHDYSIHSVTVIRNGYRVLDEYFPPFGPNSTHIIHSCTKSIVSALIGIAIDQRYVEGVDQLVLDLFPGRTAANLDADKETMTLEDLLTMSSGLECRDSYLHSWRGLDEMRTSDDWVQFMLDLSMAEPHIEQPVMKVAAIGGHDSPPFEESSEHAEDRIEYRHAKCQCRHRKPYQRMRFFGTQHTGGCKCKSQEHASAVAHEYLGRVEVQEQESRQAAQQRQHQNAHHYLPAGKRQYRNYTAHDGRYARSQAV